MRYINVRKVNCKNCYKCLKNCVVKSIKFSNYKVSVIEDKCVLCGQCIMVCPQRAKYVDNDISNIMELVYNTNVKTVLSIDPSYVVAFGDNYKKVFCVLKKLGFDFIEETSVGAVHVTSEYKRLIEENKMKNIITSNCPSTNMLITKYYPDLLDMLAPIMSPVLIHGKIIKENMGKDTKVIYSGPCLSKIKEIYDNSEYIDGVITFKQLAKLINGELLRNRDSESNEFFVESPYSSVYSISNGVVYDIKKRFRQNDFTNKILEYDVLSVSGLKNVKDILEEIRQGNINKTFIEISSCNGGCINGPLMPHNKMGSYSGRLKLKNNAGNIDFDKRTSEYNFTRKFIPEPIFKDMPTEGEIKKILSQIGKYTKSQELNCGSCGYPTCREKAIAVYQGKAELHMCLPYMTDINQTLANVTLTIMPDYIIAVDENMFIKEFNVAAQKLFKVSRNEALNKPLFEFVDTTDFEYVIKNQQTITDKKVKYDKLGIITSQTIIYSGEYTMAIAIIKDITQEEVKRDLVYNLKLESVEMAQKVIDKQMTVAQQIASLLGETTAETKVTLNKLKNLIENEGSYK